jgi:hypothetical protein
MHFEAIGANLVASRVFTRAVDEGFHFMLMLCGHLLLPVTFFRKLIHDVGVDRQLG